MYLKQLVVELSSNTQDYPLKKNLQSLANLIKTQQKTTKKSLVEAQVNKVTTLFTREQSTTVCNQLYSFYITSSIFSHRHYN